MKSGDGEGATDHPGASFGSLEGLEDFDLCK